MLGEYIVAHPLSVDCIVDDAVLDCLDPPSELLLLLLLDAAEKLHLTMKVQTGKIPIYKA